jgi:hypothetical protein
MAWEKRCNRVNGIKLTPVLESRTTPNIVPMVTMPNTHVTTNSPDKLFFAAGYIRIGIKGSHGPKTKMTNSAQGVMLGLLLSS